MTPTLIAAALEAYKVTVQLWMKTMDGMSDEARQDYLDMIARRELWWAENVFEPIGEALSGAVGDDTE